MRNEALTDERYKDEILRPIVVSCAAANGDDFMLMNDNYRTRAHLLDDFLFEEGMIRTEWSTYSMDMNSIVHVWNMQTSCWSPITTTNSPRTKKELF